MFTYMIGYTGDPSVHKVKLFVSLQRADPSCLVDVFVQSS